MFDKPEVDNTKSHHVVAANIVYRYKEEIRERSFNTLIITENYYVDQLDLHNAQQATQIRFHREVAEPSPDIDILDVFIISVSYLGRMPVEKFSERMNKQLERVKAELQKGPQNVNKAPTTANEPTQATEVEEVSKEPESDASTES